MLNCLQVGLHSITNCSFQITHNVSLDQSPITTNTSNVTLYGVQSGETYAISVGTISRIKPQNILIKIEHDPLCTIPDNEGIASNKV